VAVTFRLPAAALELAVDSMDGAGDEVAALGAQGASTDHESLARVAYLSLKAQEELGRPQPDVEWAMLLLSLADLRAPDAFPSMNRAAELADALNKRTGLRLRAPKKKRLDQLVARFRNAGGVVDL
jgi:hypothetical protein